MNKIGKWVLTAFLVFIVAGIIMPMFARNTRTGSQKHARLWKEQLQACDALQDMNDYFACYEVNETPLGRTEYIPEIPSYPGRPLALIQSFADGNWVACVHVPTHGPRSGPGAGTAVTKDSTGDIHTYMGHICDRMWISGNSLEEFYASLEKEYRFND